jgi:ATP sulfurylase
MRCSGQKAKHALRAGAFLPTIVMQPFEELTVL